MGWFTALRLALSCIADLVSVSSAVVDVIEQKTDAQGMGKEKKALAMTAVAQSVDMADGMTEEPTEANGIKKVAVMGAASVLVDSVVMFNNAANAAKSHVAAVPSDETLAAENGMPF